jgi:hypothetical protein
MLVKCVVPGCPSLVFGSGICAGCESDGRQLDLAEAEAAPADTVLTGAGR